MRGYLISVFAAVILSSLLDILIPLKGNLKKYISYTVSLFLLLTLIAPLQNTADILLKLPEMLLSIGKSEDSDIMMDEYIDNLVGEYKNSLSEKIKELVSRRYGIPMDLVTVGITVDASDYGNITVKEAVVEIGDCPVPYNREEMEQYLSDTVGSPCRVIQK